VVDWQWVKIVGDEAQATHRRDKAGRTKHWEQRLAEYEAAVRAYRQLAVELRSRGRNEEADAFAYRAHLVQRSVLLRQFKPGQWFGSLLLDAVSGHGYRPGRSLATYLLLVIGFATAYMVLGRSSPLSWNESLVVSLTAFHGRGFFATAFQPGDPQAAVAAIEAVCGLRIEITFIATFTQRFFAR
jgi:hypothetical protein